MFYMHIHKCHSLAIRNCLFTQYPYLTDYYAKISLLLCCERFILQINWKKHRLLSLQRFVKLKCICDQVYKCFQLTPLCSAGYYSSHQNLGCLLH